MWNLILSFPGHCLFVYLLSEVRFERLELCMIVYICSCLLVIYICFCLVLRLYISLFACLPKSTSLQCTNKNKFTDSYNKMNKQFSRFALGQHIFIN